MVQNFSIVPAAISFILDRSFYFEFVFSENETELGNSFYLIVSGIHFHPKIHTAGRSQETRRAALPVPARGTMPQLRSTSTCSTCLSQHFSSYCLSTQSIDAAYGPRRHAVRVCRGLKLFLQGAAGTRYERGARRPEMAEPTGDMARARSRGSRAGVGDGVKRAPRCISIDIRSDPRSNDVQRHGMCTFGRGGERERRRLQK